MERPEIIAHNEALAIQNIHIAYISSGLVDAMALCQQYMGVDTREAYDRVKMICGDLMGKED
jgi:hypothetical protein